MVGGIVHRSAHREGGLSTPSETEQPPPDLREALVAAYPPYVATVLADRGIEMDELTADAVVEGASVLDGLLTTFEATPYPDQRVSPLELFREALRPIDRALGLRGINPPETKTLGVAAWDRYQLSPGSSQVLGPEAHEAHLRWAVGKARAIAPLVNRPGAVLLPTAAEGDVAEAIATAGYRLVPDLASAVVAVVDLDLPGSEDAIAASVDAELHAVAIGDVVDDLTRVGLRAAGVARVVDRTELVTTPGEVLPTPT